MALANNEAQRFNHEYIGTEHVLLGFVREGGGVGANVLKNLGLDLRKVRLEVEKLVKAGSESSINLGSLPKTPQVGRVIDFSIEEAKQLQHNYIGTEHLLLGLIREHDSIAAQVLLNLGITIESVREGILNLLGIASTRISLDPYPSIEAVIVGCEVSGSTATLRVEHPTGAIMVPSKVRILFID